MIVFFIHAIILFCCSFFTSKKIASSTIERLLAIFILVWTNLVVTGLFLSCFSALGNRFVYFVVSVMLAFITVFVSRKESSYIEITNRESEQALVLSNWERWFERFLYASLFIIMCLNVIICIKYSPNNWDSLTYHLPRIHFYLSQGHLGHFDTVNLRQTFFPFNATLFQVFLVIYGQSDKLLNFFNLICWALSFLSVYVLSRRCGLHHLPSLLSAWLAVTTGQVLAQGTATTNDLLAAVPFVIGVIFALDWWRERRWKLALLAGAALGLALGTKLTIYFFMPGLVVLGVVEFVSVFRKRWTVQWDRRDVKQAGVAGLIIMVLALPIMGINYFYTKQFSPEHYGYLLNRPFSLVSTLQTIYTYTIGFLADPFQYVAIKAHDIWKLQVKLEPSLKQFFFPFWNKEYGVNELYVLGTGISEDGVFFGFAIYLIIIAFLYCLLHPELCAKKVVWFGAVGLGWFLTYCVLTKWSLFNQRYFIAAVLLSMPLVGQLFQVIQVQHMAWKRNMGFALFGLVIVSSLLFSYTYLFYNMPRSIKGIGKPAYNRGKIVIQKEIEPILTSQKKIKFVYSGYTHEDERLFQFMNRGKDQRFSIGQWAQDDWYNIYSFWAPTKHGMFNNIPSSSAYSIVYVPGKATAGVTALGSFGETGSQTNYFYYGYAGIKSNEKVLFDNSNILVRTIFDRFAPKGRSLEDRLRRLVVDIVGVHKEDKVIAILSYIDMQDRLKVLKEVSNNNTSLIDIPEQYKSLHVEVRDEKGRKVASSDIPVTAYSSNYLNDDIIPLNDKQTNINIITGTGNSSIAFSMDGLGPLEGPYPMLNLPKIRWADKSKVALTFHLPADKPSSKIKLSLAFSPQIREHASMNVVMNGNIIKSYSIQDRLQWVEDTLVIKPQSGKNVLELHITGTPVVSDAVHYMLFKSFLLDMDYAGVSSPKTETVYK